MTTPSQPETCPRCGAPARPGARRCWVCEAPLEGGVAVESFASREGGVSAAPTREQEQARRRALVARARRDVWRLKWRVLTAIVVSIACLVLVSFAGVVAFHLICYATRRSFAGSS